MLRRLGWLQIVLVLTAAGLFSADPGYAQLRITNDSNVVINLTSDVLVAYSTGTEGDGPLPDEFNQMGLYTLNGNTKKRLRWSEIKHLSLQPARTGPIKGKLERTNGSIEEITMVPGSLRGSDGAKDYRIPLRTLTVIVPTKVLKQ